MKEESKEKKEALQCLHTHSVLSFVVRFSLVMNRYVCRELPNNGIGADEGGMHRGLLSAEEWP